MARRGVILYSGGLDSFCLSKLYPNNDLLFFRLGTKDCLAEERHLPDNSYRLVIRKTLDLKQWEMANKIIPWRNCFLVLAAAQEYSNIFLGFTIGDTTKDKDYVFKACMEGMLNYFGLDEKKVGHVHRPFVIEMPFKEMTKTEIVASYLSSGFPAGDLVQISRSCYLGGDKECGKCRACLRKYVALKNNGLDHLADFETTPTQDALERHLEESMDKKRHLKEIEEIRRVL